MRYWDGRNWTEQFGGPVRKGVGRPTIIAGSVAAVILGAMLWEGCTKDADTRSTSTPETTTTLKAPVVSEFEVMPGDGTYNMGGMDGKNWGTWASVPQATGCVWSVRAVNPQAPAMELDSGMAEPTERARVTINPPGDVSLGGDIDGTYQVVFITRGCGSWRLVG